MKRLPFRTLKGPDQPGAPLDSGARTAIGRTAICALLWGTSFPLTLVGLESGFGPLTFVFLRFGLAAPVMVAISVAYGKRVYSVLKRREVWILGVLNALGFVCQYVGQQYTDASLAALLVNMSVVLAAAGGAVFLGERMGTWKALGVAMAVGGTFLVTTNGSLASLNGSQSLGIGLYLGSAATWAVYIVYAKGKAEDEGLEPMLLATGIVLVTAALTLPVAALSGEGIPSGGRAIGVVMYMAVLNTALPFILYQQGLQRLTAGLSAVVLMFEVVVALGVSVVFLQEDLSATALLGSGAILVSIFLVSGADLGGKSAVVEGA